MGYRTFLLFFLVVLPKIWAGDVEEARLDVDTSTTISETNTNYICATIDWWPKEKCSYNRCPWGSSSAINLDLSHPYLNNAIRAFKTLRIRVGGSLQNQLLYGTGNSQFPCQAFRKEKGGLFGFSKGCLNMERWDELNEFFKRTGVLLTFGINALQGRQHIRRGVWGGDWDSKNARDFINYTISKGYRINSWEFGNELSGRGIGASVGAEQYGKDLIKLNRMLDDLYANFPPRPPLLAPGGFYNKLWFNKLLQVSGPRVVNIMSLHMYTLGAGNDRNITRKILNPDHLNKASFILSNLSSTIQANGPWASAWVGESGGAFNNGAWDISDTFVNSFWYLDQLGLAAKYNTRVYCRQTLIGGFYGLLNETTFVPNPDYYSALLWHRLMGKGVLSVKSYGSPYLRVYAHCAKERTGIVVLLINLSNQTTFNVDVSSSKSGEVSKKNETGIKRRSFLHGLKRSVMWVGNKVSDDKLSREEYHLTSDLQSKSLLLNGKRVQLSKNGDIPSLGPVVSNLNSPLRIAPLSIKFIVYPNFDAPGCI